MPEAWDISVLFGVPVYMHPTPNHNKETATLTRITACRSFGELLLGLVRVLIGLVSDRMLGGSSYRLSFEGMHATWDGLWHSNPLLWTRISLLGQSVDQARAFSIQGKPRLRSSQPSSPLPRDPSLAWSVQPVIILPEPMQVPGTELCKFENMMDPLLRVCCPSLFGSIFAYGGHKAPEPSSREHHSYQR